MWIEITKEHIQEIANAHSWHIIDIDKAEKFIKQKIFDEFRDDGATHLCIMLDSIIVEAFENAEDFFRKEH